MKHRVNRSPGFLLSLLQSFRSNHFEFCQDRGLCVSRLVCRVSVVKVQHLSNEVLAPLSRSDLDRGPDGAT